MSKKELKLENANKLWDTYFSQQNKHKTVFLPGEKVWYVPTGGGGKWYSAAIVTIVEVRPLTWKIITGKSITFNVSISELRKLDEIQDEADISFPSSDYYST